MCRLNRIVFGFALAAVVGFHVPSYGRIGISSRIMRTIDGEQEVM